MPHRIAQDQRHKNYLARVMQQRLHPESTPSSIPAQQLSNTSSTPQSLKAVIPISMNGGNKGDVILSTMKVPIGLTEEHKNTIDLCLDKYRKSNHPSCQFEICYRYTNEKTDTQTTVMSANKISHLPEKARKILQPDIISIKSIMPNFLPLELKPNASLKESWEMVNALMIFLKDIHEEGDIGGEPVENFSFLDPSLLLKNIFTGEIKISLKGILINALIEKYNIYNESSLVTRDIGKYGKSFIEQDYLSYHFDPETFSESKTPNLPKALIYSIRNVINKLLPLAIYSDHKDPLINKLQNILYPMADSRISKRPDINQVYQQIKSINEEMNEQIMLESKGIESPFLSVFHKGIARR